MSPSNNPSSQNELVKLLEKQIGDLKESREETTLLKKENEELRNSNDELKEKFEGNLNHEICKAIKKKLETEIEEWK